MKVRDSRDCFERVWSAAVGLASGEGELPKRLRGSFASSEVANGGSCCAGIVLFVRLASYG
jgi:hypothetical protein